MVLAGSCASLSVIRKRKTSTAMLRMPSTFKTSYITHCTWAGRPPKPSATTSRMMGVTI